MVMKVSTRQEDYRMRLLRAGICTRCGNEKLVTATLGENCRLRSKKRFAKWRLSKLNLIANN